MRRALLFALVALATGSLVAILVIAGCGGSGGPILTTGGGSPSISAAFLQLLPAGQKSATYVGSSKCLPCHNDTYHANWSDTRHAQVGTGCEQCHGPGSVHVANQTKAAGPRGASRTIAGVNRSIRGITRAVQDEILTFPNIQEPVVCGQCHGPIFDQFNNSRHSGVVADVIASAHANPPGGKTCLRCHGSALRTQYINSEWTKGLIQGLDVATIQNQSDADILALTNAQVDALATASHQSANCVTCHDPHTKTGKLLASGEEKQLRRSTFSVDTSSIQPGAATKVHSNWDHMCGTCHNGRGGNPADTALLLASGTARPNFHEGPQFNMLSGVTGSLPPGAVVQNSSHFQAPDQCVHCHMPDARHTFTVSLDTSCQPCHTPTDAAAREGSVRNEILTGLLVLRTRMETWAQGKFGNPAFWDYYTLVSDDPTVQDQAKAIQPQIPIEIRRARHNYYFLVRDRSFGVHNTPYSRQLLEFAQTQLDALGISRAVALHRSRSDALGIFKTDLLRSMRSERYADPLAL